MASNVKLLLKESIKHVGRVGDIVEVSAGYARNYLLPKDLAVEPTPGNVKKVEEKKKEIERINSEVDGIRLQVLDDQSRFIERAIGNVQEHAMVGGILIGALIGTIGILVGVTQPTSAWGGPAAYTLWSMAGLGIGIVFGGSAGRLLGSLLARICWGQVRPWGTLR